MSDSINLDESIFRAYDIRGKTPGQLNDNVANLVGKALGVKAIEKNIPTILVARDGRTTSPNLAKALIAGINSQGINTIDAGMIPTPLGYWEAAVSTNGSSVIITGSHNPQEYNGIKMTINASPLAGEEVQELKNIIIANKFTTTDEIGTNKEINTTVTNYTKDVLNRPKLSRAIKLVVDCGNGVAGPVYPKIFKEFGCEVIELYTDVDGTFPNHHPDPAVPENFNDAVKLMQDKNAELIMAFDGDGDRLGVWLPNKGIFFPDRILMLLAKQLLANEKNAKVLYDVKCSVNVASYVTNLGGQAQLCRTGHSFMKKEMAATNAPLGGELSGHIFFNEGNWKFDDPLLAAIKLLELIAAEDSAEELSIQVPDSIATPEYLVPMPNEASPHDFVAKLVAKQTLPKEPKIITIDGLRAEWENAFGLVRASNTTPSLILRFEGVDQAACEFAQSSFKYLIANIDVNINLPF